MNVRTDQVPVIILCGGKGIYVDASGQRRNKALVPIAGLPMVAHVMRLYVRHGFRRFLLSTGIQGPEFPRIVGGLRSRALPEGVAVELLETGEQTTTWPRIASWEPQLKGTAAFCISYCDVLADVDLAAALQEHLTHGKVLTLAAVFQPTRFRLLGLRPPDPVVRGFAEQPILRSDRINGGFYFAKPELFDRARDIPQAEQQALSLEGKVLETLVAARQVVTYFVDGEFRYLDAERDIEPMARLATRIC
jgi:glucose-1-phosphate cytidylyltransferase